MIGNYSFITQVSAGYLGEREGRFPDSCPLVSEGQSQGNDKSQSEWVDCIKNAQYILDYRGKNGGGVQAACDGIKYMSQKYLCNFDIKK